MFIAVICLRVVILAAENQYGAFAVFAWLTVNTVIGRYPHRATPIRE